MFQAERRARAKPLRMSMPGEKQEGHQSWSKESKRGKGKRRSSQGQPLTGKVGESCRILEPAVKNETESFEEF